MAGTSTSYMIVQLYKFHIHFEADRTDSVHTYFSGIQIRLTLYYYIIFILTKNAQ